MRQQHATVLVRALVPELAREQRPALVQVRASVPAQVQVQRPALVQEPEQVQVPQRARLLVALPQV